MKKKYCDNCGTNIETIFKDIKEKRVCPVCDKKIYDHYIVGSGGILEIDNKILLLKRAHEPFIDHYNLPSGHVNDDESPEEAAIREVYEETGLQVGIDSLFGIYFFDDHPDGYGINIVYKCFKTGGKLKETIEAKESRFFSINEIPENIAGGGHNKAINDWKQRSAKNRPLLENQLNNVVAARSSQDQILWSIIGVFGAINAILLVALFPSGDLPENPLIGIIVCLIGLVVSILWKFMQRRALFHIYYLEDLESLIEQNLDIENRFSISPRLNQTLAFKYLSKKPKARTVMQIFGLGMIILWSLGLIGFLLINFNIICI
jgi:ADP-ribose pyrophosphatase YjhB (NUDIX family)